MLLLSACCFCSRAQAVRGEVKCGNLAIPRTTAARACGAVLSFGVVGKGKCDLLRNRNGMQYMKPERFQRHHAITPSRFGKPSASQVMGFFLYPPRDRTPMCWQQIDTMPAHSCHLVSGFWLEWLEALELELNFEHQAKRPAKCAEQGLYP